MEVRRTGQRHGPFGIRENHGVEHGTIGRVAAVASSECARGCPDLDLRAAPDKVASIAKVGLRSAPGGRHSYRVGPNALSHQLLDMRPSGTSPVGDNWRDSSFPKSQHTAENVENSV